MPPSTETRSCACIALDAPLVGGIHRVWLLREHGSVQVRRLWAGVMTRASGRWRGRSCSIVDGTRFDERPCVVLVGRGWRRGRRARRCRRKGVAGCVALALAGHRVPRWLP